jgi:hypothetical protein
MACLRSSCLLYVLIAPLFVNAALAQDFETRLSPSPLTDGTAASSNSRGRANCEHSRLQRGRMLPYSAGRAILKRSF